MENDRCIGVKDVAKLLSVSETLVKTQATKGNIPGRKIGRIWRFSEAALRRWMEGTNENRQTAA